MNKRNGLMAITPADRSENTLPARFMDNWDSKGSKYAQYFFYPTSAESLRTWVANAFEARDSRAELVDNRRALGTIDVPC
jgi:hypothetical protein